MADANGTNGQAAPLTPEQVSANKLADWTVKAQLAHLTESTAGSGTPNDGKPAGETPAAEPARGTAPARGPGGKFAPKEGATAKEATAERPAEEATAKTEPRPAADRAAQESASIARARKLYDDGKFDEAFKLAFGKTSEELEIKSKAWADWRHQTKTAKQELEAKRELFQREYAQAQEVYGPIARAKAALDAGDYEAFVRHATGLDPNEFSKRMLASFHKGATQTANLPPEVAKQLTEMEKRLKASEDAREELKRQTEERNKQQSIASYKAQIKDELGGLGDERFAKAATKTVFVERVFAIQAQHYDKATKETIPLEEAAEIAWGELYDFGDGGAQSAGMKNKDRGDTPVRQAAKPPTTLKQNGAAEAAGPGPKLKGDALMQAYVKKAELEALRESTGSGAS